MKQVEYLINSLQKSGISEITSALHEFHDESGVHFVKIIPTEIVDGDSYDYELSKIIIDFEDTFQGEMLCFLGETSLTQLENPVELISQKGTVKIQVGSVIYTGEQLKHNVFNSGTGPNPELITIGVLPPINTQTSRIICFFSEGDNVLANSWKVAEPSAKYGITNEDSENYYNQAA
ncbi:MAG: hypothetical protein EPN85_01390 [Bacteroidetes bacterium]|nr:MAG: hypothetical protein EPN85_01390 [Bacteroidota bacterium]